MSNNVQTISAYSLVNDVVPKLNAVETLVENTLKQIIETSTLPAQIERYTKLQVEFQLELTMIRMNLEHLLNRYHHELETVKMTRARICCSPWTYTKAWRLIVPNSFMTACSAYSKATKPARSECDHAAR
ncbi:hypothetical protein HORIV_58630 [Vreelandella olivaria]|uniref:Uncharacterized protein n=1 Tax=Vreelandella olivaria TaxID=390919 RepID=A0ABM7GRT5_9GAMM|nr:hypothetical protein HORIV_58630 [Halomonas olivaria]